MSDRPQPPSGSEFLTMYEEGAQVYYYRSGKWRLAQIRSAESSGKRYVVLDIQNQETYHADIGKIATA
ncbi:hypothetical protein ABVK25_012511 [Lepraria finkii]|uniref:Uncharacterized protein n=1 Tax=Lepraria finkii TaxID=1340010 RepID=A0ABR4AE49_9LECA